MSHSAEGCFGKRTNQNTIKDGLGGPMGSSSEDVKQYKNSDSKCKKDLNALKNHNKILFSITKNFGSRRELKNTKKIRAKASKQRCNSSIDSSSDESDSNYSLSRDSY